MKRQCIISGGLTCPQCHGTGQLQGGPGGPQPSAEPSNACALLRPDLPGPWVSKLVQQHLGRLQRLALFQTSSSMAALVVQHSGELTLRPMKHVRESSERTAWVMGLAAGCNNIHLFVKKGAVLLDTPAIWPCITQLTLCDVGLSRRIISRLMLPRLTALHTLRLTTMKCKPEIHEHALDVSAVDSLRSIIQDGGLKALRTLQGRYDVLCKLAPVVGAQITRLVLVQTGLLAGFANQWPRVQHLVAHTIPWHNSGQLQHQLFCHPKVKHVTLPAVFLSPDSSLTPAPPCWDSLEITGNLGLNARHCTIFQCTRHLRLPAMIYFYRLTDCEAFVTALQGLGSASLTLNQTSWMCCTQLQSQVSSSMPTILLSFHADLMRCVFDKCPEVHGGLVLDNGRWEDIRLGPHLAALAQIPLGVHTLLLRSCSLGAGCTWADVMASIPAHMQHLLIEECELSKASFLAVLDQPAPVGLRTVTLASSLETMCWVPWEGYELISMQALITSKWPNVRLVVDHSAEEQSEHHGEEVPDPVSDDD